MLRPNLVVTGRADGRSAFVDERPLTPVSTPELAGLDLFLAWGTADGTASNSDERPTPVLAPYFPGPGGTRLVLVTWLPAGQTGQAATPSADEADLLAGLAATLEKDDPGMHTSATLDYGIVLSGEMWLELDEGAERRLPPGSCVVQRGTRHRWSNRGTEPATMAFVLIGAERDR
ncbi:cupin domain-containing protein [Amycolatopsis pigmentata]|uniref:Cupin domain-containing protein n=1 Tax=Amycolatopsis pigmentata TaxID=450801 RepID=A0ABW5G7X1_9PSEU